MSEGHKNTGKSFLQKFEGKTNKIGKQGIQQTLVNQSMDQHKQQSTHEHPHLRKVDLDEIIPSNPEKKPNQNVKRRQTMNRPINPNNSKGMYVPSSFTPQQSNKEEISGMPPSRGFSLSTQNSRGKYFFGKFLKLDKEAMGHIEFLQNIEEKRSFFHRNRRSARSPELK